MSSAPRSPRRPSAGPSSEAAFVDPSPDSSNPLGLTLLAVGRPLDGTPGLPPASAAPPADPAITRTVLAAFLGTAFAAPRVPRLGTLRLEVRAVSGGGS